MRNSLIATASPVAGAGLPADPEEFEKPSANQSDLYTRDVVRPFSVRPCPYQLSNFVIRERKAAALGFLSESPKQVVNL
jgi:hypothetical protein